MTPSEGVSPAPSLDPANRCLWIADRRVELAPKVYEVLLYLAQHGERLVGRRELLDAVWPDTHVTEAALTVVIGRIRDLLGDDGEHLPRIQTLHRRGYRLVGPLAIGGRTPAVTRMPEPETPSFAPAIVGREAALQVLEDAYRRVAAGTRQLVFVSGEPGIGKTTVVEEFIRRLGAGRSATDTAAARQSAKFRVGRGQCAEPHAGEAYSPLLIALERLCREPAAAEQLRRCAPTWLAQIPALSPPGERELLNQMSMLSTPERMLRELSTLLDELGRDQPLVLLIEDLHWSDHASVAALAAFAQSREPSRVLWIGTVRPVDSIISNHPIASLRLELRGKRLCSEIALVPFTPADVEAYLALRLADGNVPPHLSRMLHQQTSGNPLFLALAVEELIEHRQLYLGDGRWQLATAAEAIAASVPESVREIIRYRLDRLPLPMRELLKAGSAIGIEFPSQAVVAALEREPVEVDDAADLLVRSGMLRARGPSDWPDGTVGTSFAFFHPLLRQVAYDSIPVSRREALHRRLANVLEAGFASTPTDIAGALAMQFELAGDARRAARSRRDAARLAIKRHGYLEAVEHAQRGLSLLSKCPQDEAVLQLALELDAAMLAPTFALHGPASALPTEIGERILLQAEGRKTTPGLLHAIGTMMNFHMTHGRLRDAQTAAEELLKRSQGTPWESISSVIARSHASSCRLYRGQLGEVLPDLEAAMALPSVLPLASFEFPLVAAVDVALAKCLLGFSDSALGLGRDACERAEATNHFPTMALVFFGVLRVAMILHDDVAVERVARHIEVVTERFPALQPSQIGHDWLEVAYGYRRARAGDAGGIESMQAAASCHLADRRHHSLYSLVLADAMIAVGRLDDARAGIDDAFERMAAHDERWHEAEMHRLRAVCLLATARRARRSASDASRAEESLRRAVEVARAQRSKWWELRAALQLASLWSKQRRQAEARALLVPLCDSFTEGEQLPDLVAARRLASELDG